MGLYNLNSFIKEKTYLKNPGNPCPTHIVEAFKIKAVFSDFQSSQNDYKSTRASEMALPEQKWMSFVTMTQVKWNTTIVNVFTQNLKINLGKVCFRRVDNNYLLQTLSEVLKIKWSQTKKRFCQYFDKENFLLKNLNEKSVISTKINVKPSNFFSDKVKGNLIINLVENYKIMIL